MRESGKIFGYKGGTVYTITLKSRNITLEEVKKNNGYWDEVDYMKKYIEEAKEKATSIEKYAIENGVVRRRYIDDGSLIVIFDAPYDIVHKSVVYYNCTKHRFCNILGK